MLKKKTTGYLSTVCREDIRGRIVVITGANSGVGYKAAEELAWLGAEIVMACRNRERAEAARAGLLESVPGAKVSIRLLDLADSASIDAFVDSVIEDGLDIYGFVNNAGVFNMPGRTTKDGHELVMGTNYLGTFRLTMRLLPYLKILGHEVRLVNTTSIAYLLGKVSFEDFFMTRNYSGLGIYSASKLCVTAWSQWLAGELGGSNVRLVLSHPGVSATPLALRALRPWARTLVSPFTGLLQSPEKCALAIPYLLTNAVEPGSLHGPGKLLGFYGRPVPNRISRKAFEIIPKLILFTRKLLGD